MGEIKDWVSYCSIPCKLLPKYYHFLPLPQLAAGDGVKGNKIFLKTCSYIVLYRIGTVGVLYYYILQSMQTGTCSMNMSMTMLLGS